MSSISSFSLACCEWVRTHMGSLAKRFCSPLFWPTIIRHLVPDLVHPSFQLIHFGMNVSIGYGLCAVSGKGHDYRA